MNIQEAVSKCETCVAATEKALTAFDALYPKHPELDALRASIKDWQSAANQFKRTVEMTRKTFAAKKLVNNFKLMSLTTVKEL